MKSLLRTVLVVAAVAWSSSDVAGQMVGWIVDTDPDTQFIGDSQTLVDNTSGSADLLVAIQNNEESTGTFKVKNGIETTIVNSGSGVFVTVEAGKKLEISVTGTNVSASGSATIN